MTDRAPGLKFLAFAVLCVVAAGWVASVTGNISRIPFFSDSNDFEAVLDDASGLSVGDDVRLAGVPIGRVNAIAVERGNALVAFTIDPEVEVATSWEAGARWRNVIGQRYLYLYEVPGGPPLEPGGRLPVEQSRPVADIGRFFNEITPLLRALDPQQQNRLIDALNTTLLGREEQIQGLVVELSELSDTVADQEPQLQSVLENANLLLAEYNARDDQLLAFVDSLALAADTLAARNDEVLGAAVDLADVQERLAELIEANDAGLIASVDSLEVLTSTLGTERVAFEETLASLRQGLATYMLISRFGQWFNVRGVAVQVQENGQVISCSTEQGAPCSAPNSLPPGGSPAGSPGPVPALPAAGVPLSVAPARLDGLSVVAGLALGQRPGDPLLATAAQP